MNEFNFILFGFGLVTDRHLLVVERSRNVAHQSSRKKVNLTNESLNIP